MVILSNYPLTKKPFQELIRLVRILYWNCPIPPKESMSGYYECRRIPDCQYKGEPIYEDKMWKCNLRVSEYLR